MLFNLLCSVLCITDHCSFDYCIVYPLSYGLRLSIWYFQTFLSSVPTMVGSKNYQICKCCLSAVCPGIMVICSTGVTCLSLDCCLSDVVHPINRVGLIQRSLYHRNGTCSHHTIVDLSLSTITHSQWNQINIKCTHSVKIKSR